MTTREPEISKLNVLTLNKNTKVTILHVSFNNSEGILIDSIEDTNIPLERAKTCLLEKNRLHGNQQYFKGSIKKLFNCNYHSQIPHIMTTLHSSLNRNKAI